MNKHAFTIVELLVVIVVIAVLATITIVSFTGITQKATASSFQLDLSNASKQLKMYQVEYGKYPQYMTSIDSNVTYCPSGITTTPDSRYCIKPSSGNEFVYNSPGSSSYSTFTLDATDSNSTTYTITNNSIATLIPTTVVIGAQTWTKYNLNVGVRINSGSTQADNSVIEKHCYGNSDENCSTYGGLYQWNEMMQYTTTPGAQGICPLTFHIPTDDEYKTLEIYLLMTPTQASTVLMRGTDQGTKLKVGGMSGFDGLIGGYTSGGASLEMGTYGVFWTSTQSNTSLSWYRYLSPGDSRVGRWDSDGYKTDGQSVKCLRD